MNQDNLSPEDESFILNALQRWATQVDFRGDVGEFFGVAWEAWEGGRIAGIEGKQLRQRIIWRLQDAQRAQASPLKAVGVGLEAFEKVGKGVFRGNDAGNVLEALQTWAIEEWPDLSPVWKGEVPLAEVRNLHLAKRRTVWYLSEMGQGTFSGTIRQTTLTGIHVQWGQGIVLNAVRRMRYRLKTLGYQNILRERWGTGSGH